jgi:hypothetical protein
MKDEMQSEALEPEVASTEDSMFARRSLLWLTAGFVANGFLEGRQRRRPR